ncbi:type II secretion system protein GspL [Thermomonas sp.]|uniref:type II secretion system protein GspL n=1 Tax=Thermomonas sp. TaxID=1971895 RepID=UPI0024898F49|nr:type II secretion system protein GspL [Thermomonas sp.]MDI1254355.1 type II secretion system protein GspL [Thermomonas sp.]
MSLLRIRASLLDPALRCQWALVNDERLDQGSEAVVGEGLIADLPRHAGRVQLVIPAAQVLITRAHLPQAARRNVGSVLAFAVEEQTAGDPDANQVSWLGTAGDHDVLAVVDKAGLARWRAALDAVGVHGYEVHGEALMLPWAPGEWSLAWNGSEGFVRSGELEAAATDCGDHATPPLLLRLMLDEAAATGASPAAIALYTTAPGAAPDAEAWTRQLGVAMRLAGPWDWRTAPSGTGVCLTQERQRWRAFAGLPARLRPAGWILGTALAIHAAALVVDWTSLASEQSALRQQMESRFRRVFPDAVAVADPALQMRRKLAEARHAAGQSDSGDFLPMIEQVATATTDLPAGAVRTLSYEDGRLTLELASVDAAGLSRVAARLMQAGLSVELPPASTGATSATVVMTVRAA